MRNVAAVFIAGLILAGCVAGSGITYSRVTTTDSGEVIKETLEVVQPEDPKGGCYFEIGTNFLAASTSAAQSAASKQGVIEEGKTKRVLYYACGLLFLLGAVALALPNALVSNKDALLILGAALLAAVVITFVQAAAPTMRWILPLLLVLAVAYFGFMFYKGRVVKTATRRADKPPE